MAYLKNKNKHKESEAYKQLLEYKQLKNSSVIKEFFRLQKKYLADFKEMNSWTPVFTDEFQAEKLNPHWNTKPFWSLKLPMAPYAQNTEYHHINTSNVSVNNNMLRITTQYAPQAGMAWDQQFGFVPRNFDYTSGVVNTAESFELLHGKVEVRFRVPATKNIYHALWCCGAESTPAISLFNMRNQRLETGIYHNKSKDIRNHYLRLNPAHFYIMEMEWNEHTITWKLNGVKWSTKPNTIKTPLHLHFASGVMGKINKQRLPIHFEIDHIRIYKKTS